MKINWIAFIIMFNISMFNKERKQGPAAHDKLNTLE